MREDISNNACRADAVVVGLCSHGLAVARSLHSAGARILAIESNRNLPGTNTNVASVEFVESIKADELCGALLAVAERRRFNQSQPVLFLTNDSMVRAVGEGWEKLAPYFRLSWSECREQTLRLLGKDSIASFCETAGVDFPKSMLVNSLHECASVGELLPAAVKPAEPMGAFKVSKVESVQELEQIVQSYPDELPLIVQEWIPGGPEALVFASGFATEGELQNAFSGYKVRSWPLASGQGSVIAPLADPDVIAAARQFVSVTDLTGPIAVEFKRRPDGRLALIEPNVGRTEYCTEAATVNGVDIARAEYAHVMGYKTETRQQLDRYIWCDFERDAGSTIAALGHCWRVGRWLVPTTPFLRVNDLRPFFVSLKQRFTQLVRKIGKKALLLK